MGVPHGAGAQDRRCADALGRSRDSLPPGDRRHVLRAPRRWRARRARRRRSDPVPGGRPSRARHGERCRAAARADRDHRREPRQASQARQRRGVQEQDARAPQRASSADFSRATGGSPSRSSGACRACSRSDCASAGLPRGCEARSSSRSRSAAPRDPGRRWCSLAFPRSSSPRRFANTWTSLPSGKSGWLAALRDRYVGRTLSLLHAQPAYPWTVEALARKVGLSRSALAQRFTALIGVTADAIPDPMANLARGGAIARGRRADHPGGDGRRL